jgi:hypothetical protein
MNTCGDMKNAYNISVAKCGDRHSGDIFIWNGVHEVACEGVDWIHLAQDRDQ